MSITSVDCCVVDVDLLLCVFRPLEKGWEKELGPKPGRKKQPALRGPSSSRGGGRSNRGRGAPAAAVAAARRGSSRSSSKEPEEAGDESSSDASSHSDESSSDESDASDSDFSVSEAEQPDNADSEDSESHDASAGSPKAAAAAAQQAAGNRSRSNSRSRLARSSNSADPEPMAAANDKKSLMPGRSGKKGGLSSSRHGSNLKLDDEDLEVAGLLGVRRNQGGDDAEADEQVGLKPKSQGIAVAQARGLLQSELRSVMFVAVGRECWELTS